LGVSGWLTSVKFLLIRQLDGIWRFIWQEKIGAPDGEKVIPHQFFVMLLPLGLKTDFLQTGLLVAYLNFHIKGICSHTQQLITLNLVHISSLTLCIAGGKTLRRSISSDAASTCCSFLIKVFFVSVARLILLMPFRMACCS
jgi:hypothetical protein